MNNGIRRFHTRECKKISKFVPGIQLFASGRRRRCLRTEQRMLNGKTMETPQNELLHWQGTVLKVLIRKPEGIIGEEFPIECKPTRTVHQLLKQNLHGPGRGRIPMVAGRTRAKAQDYDREVQNDNRSGERFRLRSRGLPKKIAW